jgi:hypothetical protein
MTAFREASSLPTGASSISSAAPTCRARREFIRSLAHFLRFQGAPYGVPYCWSLTFSIQSTAFPSSFSTMAT